MILYNTTFMYDTALEAMLRDWLRNEWLPKAVLAGMSAQLCARVPSTQDDAGSVAVQGRFVDSSAAQRWHDGAGAELLGFLYEKYGERVLAFSTAMDVFEP